MRAFIFLVPPAGLEPATNGLRVRCSTKLSYGGIYCALARIRTRKSTSEALRDIRFTTRAILFNLTLKVAKMQVLSYS